MLQQCSHPNVVRYLGSYQGEEYLWVGFIYFIFKIIKQLSGVFISVSLSIMSCMS